MLFTELRFLAFFASLFSVYWLLPQNRYRKLLLLAASYYFYACWDWRFLGLILLSTATDYYAGLAIASSTEPRSRKGWLLLSIVVNLGLLGAFKYYDFFATSAAALISHLGWQADPMLLNVILPVGISFYTFQTMSYTIDVYRKELQPTRTLPDFALFVAFFPQLVAGPIVRARTFMGQLTESRRFGDVDFRWAMGLFLAGFIKKVCIADNLAIFVDPFFIDPAAYGLAHSWAALASYTAQIYCDFSGYTDMAIATAAVLGYRLTENFNAPYTATSVTDFWRRWHISLSSWLRDYLYISMGGNRFGLLRTYSNLLLTMLLGGLWHGASWNFLLWGGLHGLALAGHRAYRQIAPANVRLPTPIAMLLTLIFVMLMWVPFRAADFGTTLQIWAQLFSWSPAQGKAPVALGDTLLFTGFAALWAVHYLRSTRVTMPLWRMVPAGVYATSYGMLVAIALAARATDFAPFIYFQF